MSLRDLDVCWSATINILTNSDLGIFCVIVFIAFIAILIVAAFILNSFGPNYLVHEKGIGLVTGASTGNFFFLHDISKCDLEFSHKRNWETCR